MSVDWRGGARFFARSWWLQLKQLGSGRLQQVSILGGPLAVASVAAFMFRGSTSGEGSFQVALGAGLLGMWSSTLFGSGAAISRHRDMNLLESLVAAPMPLVLTVLPVTLASASLGLYSVVAVLLWNTCLFGVAFAIHNVIAFLGLLVALVFVLATLGLLLGALHFAYPAAQSVSAVSEFPIALLSGLLVPTSALPHFLRHLSMLLAPMWGVRLLDDSVTGSNMPANELIMFLGLGASYLIAAHFLLRVMVGQAREKARLALA